MATKKKVLKKRATDKPIARKVHRPTSPKDYVDAKTGELLNPRHEMFCQVWVQTFNNAEALAKCGYKAKTAKAISDQSRALLRQPHIQARVRAILFERVQEYAVTEDWIVLKMIDVMDKALATKPILNSEGVVVGEEYNDLRVALSTLEKLGQNVGMFKKDSTEKAPTVIFNMNYGTKDADQAKQLTRQPIDSQSERLN